MTSFAKLGCFNCKERKLASSEFYVYSRDQTLWNLNTWRSWVNTGLLPVIQDRLSHAKIKQIPRECSLGLGKLRSPPSRNQNYWECPDIPCKRPFPEHRLFLFTVPSFMTVQSHLKPCFSVPQLRWYSQRENNDVSFVNTISCFLRCNGLVSF